MLDFLDLVGLVPDRVIGREHLLELPGPALELLGHRVKIVIEAFFARKQVAQQRQIQSPLPGRRTPAKTVEF